MTVRSPTDEEFEDYDGMHCRIIWRSLPATWRCPVCTRSKLQILQWGERKGSNARIYGKIGWKAGIHRHHDHGSGKGRKRFADTYVCGACNLLDARLKAKTGASTDFSFSPSEMKMCLIMVRPNAPIRVCDIDFAKATKILRIHAPYAMTIVPY